MRAEQPHRIGRAQLTLVEHALCPLDPRVSGQQGSLYTVQFPFTDKNRNRQAGTAQIASPFGLMPNDELYLYGLLALTFSQPSPSPEFSATPHWCLRQLGLVEPSQEQGERYRIFREALRRLAGVVYENDRFYDPIRGEHRQVAFGLLKYSLPLDPKSSRAWQFVWDTQFYRFCEATQGSFRFDLEMYRSLDCASRRLFLLLQKVFHRRELSPDFELRNLGIHVLGFSESLPTKHLKSKLTRCANRLFEAGVISLPDGMDRVNDLIRKQSKGVYRVQFHRGIFFDGKPFSQKLNLEDSPLVEPLRTIGFEDAAIGRILKNYSSRLIAEWSDITLAAIERKLPRESPAAYFTHYIREAKAKRTTPPDWWRELRRQENEQRREEYRTQPSQSEESTFEDYLRSEAAEAFENVTERLFRSLRESGQADHEARENAEYTARMHLRRQFRQAYPNHDQSRMSSIGDLLSR